MADTLPPWMKDAKPVDTADTSAPTPDPAAPSWLKDAKPVDAPTPFLDEKTRDLAAKDDEVYKDELTKLLNKPGTTVDDVKRFDAEVGRTDPTGDNYQSVKDNLDFIKKNGPNTPTFVNPLNPLAKGALGAVRGVQHVIEGAGQLGVRAAGAAGIISPETAKSAQESIKDFSDRADARFEQGVPGKIGAFIGESAALPIPAIRAAKVIRGGEEVAAPFLSGANALRTAKLAGAGAAAGAVTGAEATGADQDAKALLGGALTALGTPIVEGLVSKVGVPAARAFFDRWQTGVGKKLYDDAGNLTPAGRVFRARLMHASPGVDPGIVDTAMQRIRELNPKQLPDTKNIVPEMVASKEGVPLTAGMKTGNQKQIQDFESAQTGVLGANAQNAAVQADSDIDNAVLNNVMAIKGNRNTSSQSAARIGEDVAKEAKKAQDTKNALYEPLNQSSERLTRPSDLLSVRDRVIDNTGETSVRADNIRDVTTRLYMERLNKMARSKNVPFGDLWALAKDVNQVSRQGQPTRTLIELRKGLNDFINNAPPDLFESGNRGVFDQLQKANAANKDYMERFFPKKGAGVQDSAGTAVQKIRALAQDPMGTPEQIEQVMFGGAGKLDSAGAKRAASIIQRLEKAAPGAQQRAKEIAFNRLEDQMVDGISAISGQKSLSPAKAAKAINDSVENNLSLWKAVGLNDREIQTLKNNAYLIARKSASVGARARGSSATNRGLGLDVRGAVRSLIGAVAGGGGALTMGGGNLTSTAAALAGAGVATAAKAAKRASVARKALDTRVPNAAADLGSITVGRGRVKVPLTSIIQRGTRTAAGKTGKPNND